jgi:conserved domain protein
MMNNNLNNQAVPTLEEIESIYEDILRSESRLNEENDLVNLGEFYKRFRKEENKREESKSENTIIKEYRKYLKNEENKQKKLIEELENLISYEKFFLEIERKRNQKYYNSNFYGSNEATRYRVDKINSYSKELREIINNSPDAWRYYYHRQLINDIQTGYNQDLVEVEYVIQAKRKIIESLKQSTPVYIIGHLGSGKTQMAREAAIEFTLENIIQEELEDQMGKWFLKNQNASEDEAIEKFSELNRDRRDYYKNLLKEGNQVELEKIYPYFISGSYNLTYEDMFVEKTLSLEKTSSYETNLELIDEVVDQYFSWLKTHKNQLENIEPEKQEIIKSKVWNSISEIFIARNSIYGTVVKKIEREILLAVRNGRPVIIDELNTIAMQNLIGLNDILQSKFGAKAYVTGFGPVTIKKGFGLIGTGNLSTDLVSYEGTNELNPAFKSRFLTIEYNYVNQNTVGSLKNQTDSEKNELFRIMLVRLADNNGNLHLPTPTRSLEEIFRLAQLSKVSQEVFMGRRISTEKERSSEDVPELKESVLSLRNVLRILDNWNLGEEKDLTLALWDGFISSITNPKDQAYILSQAVRFGFFKESEGWSINKANLGKVVIEYDEIRTRPYQYIRGEIETLSYLDLIKIIFGPVPERKELPDFLKAIDNGENKISVEEYEQLDERLNQLEHSKYLIDYIIDMENNRK